MSDDKFPDPPPRRISVEEAVLSARAYLEHLSKTGLLGGPATDITLEGFKKSGDGSWIIVLGYRMPLGTGVSSAFIEGLRANRPEFFKRFVVDSETGEVVKMGARLDPRRD